MIELTINDKKIRTEKGNTILRAALDNGIKIPNLCYDKRLLPHGGCRMCVVEIEGQKKLEASCATLATEGMVVKTDTPRVRKIRQTVLEFILVHHPLDCPVCDKAGECDIQDLVYEYGKPAGRFVGEKKQIMPDTRGALVELTANRCILCGKCVRLCSEYQGKGALGFIGRGFPTVVQPAFGEPLACDYCGQCIDICPTGALLNKSLKFKGRTWNFDEKETICPYCGCGCTLTLGINEGKIVRSRGKEDRGVNEGNLCSRGRFGFDYLYSEGRLKTPLIRKDNVLTPASWDEALEHISVNLKKILAVHGPSSVGAFGSPHCTNEDNYVLQKFMRNVIKTDNIDSTAAFGYGLAEKAYEMAFGLKGHTSSIKAARGKKVILVVESDFSASHPVFGLNIFQARKEGSQLIVADARETKLARHSTRWIKMQCGTGVALLNGMMKIMIDRDLYDKEHAAKISGFSALEEMLQKYSPENVSMMTGIAAEDLVAVTETFAKAESRMIALSLGVSENTKGLDTVLAAANLINLLNESPEVLQIPAEHANTVGLYQMGIRPDTASGSPKTNSMGIKEMLYNPGSLKALYIMGSDPVVGLPNSTKIIETLGMLDFLIVQDIELTDTAKRADVVLPAAAWSERDGLFTNTEGTVQQVIKALEPPGQSLPDWQILRNLSLTMRHDIGIRNRDDIIREMPSAEPHGAPTLSRTFRPVQYVLYETAGGFFPLQMVVRDLLQHAGSMSTRSKTLRLVASEAILEMNGDDATRFGISSGGHVRVSSRRGSVYLKAAVADDVPAGAVYVSTHFPHSAVNMLTTLSVDGRTALGAVRLEAAA